MEESSLEELKTRLYSKKSSVEGRKKDIKFKPQESSGEIKKGWVDEPEDTKKLIEQIIPKKPMPTWLKKTIIISTASVILLAVVGFFYSWLSGINSSNVGTSVEVRLSGPVSTVAGDPMSVRLEIQNKGNINISSADLVLEYPTGMRLANNQNVELAHDRKTLGRINAGESVNQILELVAFGEGGSEKNIKARVEYKLENSSAVLTNEGNYTFQLSQSPIDISLNFPSEVKTKQELSLGVEVKSNSGALLKDLYLQVDYPPGFKYTGADPAPLKDNIWKLGDLMQGKSKTITINGSIEGQDMEEKFFHAQVGTMSQDKISNVYSSTGQSVVLKKPAFNVSILINGSDQEKNIVSSGGNVEGQIVLANDMPVSVQDANVVLGLGGQALDQSSIVAEGGFFRASDGSLVWNKNTSSGLRNLDAGASQTLTFSFKVKKPLPISSYKDKNFTIDLDLSATGKKIDVGGENVEITSATSKKLLVNSNLQFAVRGLHYSGPFASTGPMPPKVGQETTYTIIWSLINTSNDVSDVKIQAALPAYMHWLGAVAPSGAAVTFDKSSGMVTWNEGTVRAGSGILSQAEEVAFQVGLTPTPNQIDTSPNILLSSVITGTDSFTGASFNYSKPELDTILNDDPQFDPAQGTVAK